MNKLLPSMYVVKKYFIISILLLLAPAFFSACFLIPPETATTTTLATTTTTTTTIVFIPPSTEFFTSNQTRADKLIGFSTNSFTDANLSNTNVAQLKPRFMRYYFGSSVVFNQAKAPNGIVSVQGGSPWSGEEGGIMGILASGPAAFEYNPELSFDAFIALCQATGAEPVVLLPIYAAYPTTLSWGIARMTKEEMYQAHINFVRYANVTKGYNVKYWEIGNEDDIFEYSPTASQYSAIFNELVPRLKAASPDFLIQCGANTFWDVARWKAELPLLKNTMDFAVIHAYSVLSDYPNFLAGQNQKTPTPQIQSEAIQVDAFNTAYNSLAPSERPPSNKAIVTEISSLCVFPFLGSSSPVETNCTYKGLLNAEMLLDMATRGNVFGIMMWCSYYAPGLTGNVFTDSNENVLSPTGMSIKVLNDHLYNNLVAKTTYSISGSAASPGTVEVWVSHNDDFTKMSIFMLNKNLTSATGIPLPLAGFVGTANNTKWVYSGTSQYAQTMTYVSAATDVSNLTTPQTVTLAPLSVTVYDFQP